MSRRGFTFIEMLVVMVVLGVLASLATIRYIDLTNEAVSAGIASQMHAVRLAAYNYYADYATWPPEVGPGVVPPQLKPYLPQNMSFVGPKYQLDWENLGGGASGGGGGGGGGGNGDNGNGNGNGNNNNAGADNSTIAVTISNVDPRLLIKLAARLGKGGRPYVMVSGTLTYVIVDPNGIY